MIPQEFLKGFVRMAAVGSLAIGLVCLVILSASPLQQQFESWISHSPAEFIGSTAVSLVIALTALIGVRLIDRCFQGCDRSIAERRGAGLALIVVIAASIVLVLIKHAP